MAKNKNKRSGTKRKAKSAPKINDVVSAAVPSPSETPEPLMATSTTLQSPVAITATLTSPVVTGTFPYHVTVSALTCPTAVATLPSPTGTAMVNGR